MNKVIILLVVVVCVAACNARVLLAKIDLDDYSDDRVGLSYPGDCKSKTLRKFAERCGLKVAAGSSHYIVKDPKTNEQITTIPHTVKENGTCRSIISVLNDRCDYAYYNSYDSYEYYNNKDY